jgi:hypothetical protein
MHGRASYHVRLLFAVRRLIVRTNVLGRLVGPSRLLGSVVLAFALRMIAGSAKSFVNSLRVVDVLAVGALASLNSSGVPGHAEF